jgi:hypothetical protein
MGKSLSQFYDHYTVDEWLEQHMKPLEDNLDKLMNMARSLTEKNSWQRRPLGNINNFAENGNFVTENPLEQLPKR